MINSGILNRYTPDEPGITPFQPQTQTEEFAARIFRLMLNCHILRAQLEGAVPNIQETERIQMRKDAIELRREGFRAEKQALDTGHKISYDDELVRRQGTRIAYMLGRGETEAAKRHVENVIATAVHSALYDDREISIAA